MKCIHSFIQSLRMAGRFLLGVSMRGKESVLVSVLWKGPDRMNVYYRSLEVQSASMQCLCEYVLQRAFIRTAYRTELGSPTVVVCRLQR